MLKRFGKVDEQIHSLGTVETKILGPWDYWRDRCKREPSCPSFKQTLLYYPDLEKGMLELGWIIDH
jgi:hypothetical protein